MMMPCMIASFEKTICGSKPARTVYKTLLLLLPPGLRGLFRYPAREPAQRGEEESMIGLLFRRTVCLQSVTAVDLRCRFHDGLLLRGVACTAARRVSHSLMAIRMKWATVKRSVSFWAEGYLLGHPRHGSRESVRRCELWHSCCCPPWLLPLPQLVLR